MTQYFSGPCCECPAVELVSVPDKLAECNVQSLCKTSQSIMLRHSGDELPVLTPLKIVCLGFCFSNQSLCAVWHNKARDDLRSLYSTKVNIDQCEPRPNLPIRLCCFPLYMTLETTKTNRSSCSDLHRCPLSHWNPWNNHDSGFVRWPAA